MALLRSRKSVSKHIHMSARSRWILCFEACSLSGSKAHTMLNCEHITQFQLQECRISTSELKLFNVTLRKEFLAQLFVKHFILSNRASGSKDRNKIWTIFIVSFNLYFFFSFLFQINPCLSFYIFMFSEKRKNRTSSSKDQKLLLLSFYSFSKSSTSFLWVEV